MSVFFRLVAEVVVTGCRARVENILRGGGGPLGVLSPGLHDSETERHSRARERIRPEVPGDANKKNPRGPNRDNDKIVFSQDLRGTSKL